MKFVKENLTLVICGAVVVLFLVFALAPLPYTVPSLNSDLKAQMAERWSYRDTIKNWAKEPIELPGGIKDKGVPPQGWVEAKNELIKGMEQQQKEVENLAKQYNSQGRLDKAGVPILPLMSQASEGMPIPGYLPKITADAMAYKMNYGQLVKRWTGLLATGGAVDMEPEAVLPPRAERLKLDWDESEKVRISKLPPGGGGGSFSGGTNTKAERDYAKRMVISRATNLQMYVMDNAFQVRDWFSGTTQPDETQIFESLVDSWFQADVVKAIAAVNGPVLKALPAASDRNVFKAPVKRLSRIIVGNNAKNQVLSAPTQSSGGAAATPGVTVFEGGQLFFMGTNAGGGTAGAGGAPVSVAGSNQGLLSTGASVVLPDTPNKTDYTLGMTGRSAGKTHDVVYMSVTMEIDPAYLNKFIDQLYRQNMCYTVTNMQMRSVDPLVRASEGFLYGDVPVVEVQMLVECLLFRSWTEAVMPVPVKLSLGGTQKAAG
jgi:hypothetical protein